MVEPTIAISFIAGIVSFLSPCVLPLIPGFLAYLGGTSAGKPQRIKIFFNSIAFVLGFSLVFSILGIILNTILEDISYTVQTWLSRIGGIIIILFGLYLLGLIKFKFLEKEHKLKVKKRFTISYLTSFVFGMAFAFGWTPCVGAILGSILTLAATQAGKSFALLLSYSLGLGLPFLAVGLFTTRAVNIINKSEKALRYFNIIVGILLIMLGILVFTNKLAIIAGMFFPRFLFR